MGPCASRLLSCKRLSRPGRAVSAMVLFNKIESENNITKKNHAKHELASKVTSPAAELIGPKYGLETALVAL